ncbi:unnamed protein product, partial [Mesorhabditis belari]|uniref:Uncharacterized protein n=1 Tax=Mesorhabditis belari TaxID=2138241 RepID=A0AAF3F124_9BILA
MNRVIFVFLATSAAAFASNSLCEQYVECMAAVRNKQQQCATLEDTAFQNTKLNECEAARDEHNKMNQLLAEKAAAEDKCVSEKAASATELTGKRKEKCDKVSTAFETGTATPPAATTESEKVRRALSKGLKNKAAKLQHRACLRDSRQQRSKCVALAKCCQPVKQCQNDTTFKSKIVALRKTTKEKTKACRQATQKRAQATRVKKAKKANKGKKNKQNKNETSTVAAKTA